MAKELRGSLEELLAAYSVDLTLHGHHHSYQRSCPLLSGDAWVPALVRSTSLRGGERGRESVCVCVCERERER